MKYMVKFETMVKDIITTREFMEEDGQNKYGCMAILIIIIIFSHIIMIRKMIKWRKMMVDIQKVILHIMKQFQR